MRRYLASSALALAMLAPTAAQADPTVAVLGIEPLDVPEQLGQAVTDALRQRAAATPGIRVVPGKDLVEMKMIFGCDGEQASCMAQAGRSLGAEKLLYGTIKKAGQGRGAGTNVVVGLKLLDVNTGLIERFVNETVTRRDIAPGYVSPLASKWFAALVEVEAKPTLNITTEPAGATVSVDGQSAGRTPITLRDLSAGKHDFVISLAGRVTINKVIELKPGGSHEVSLQMEAESAPPSKQPQPPPPQPAQQQQLVAPVPPPPASHPGRAAKGVAIGAFAAAVVAGAVAIYTWRTYRDLEDTAHNDLAALAKTPQAAQNKSFFDNPTCNPPSSLPGTQAYKDHCSSGQTYADATTALWVTAGALAAAGVVSIIIGERQSAKARETPPKSTASAGRLIQQSLRLAPVFTTKSGGLSASFEF
jgi:PEGA domain